MEIDLFARVNSIISIGGRIIHLKLTLIVEEGAQIQWHFTGSVGGGLRFETRNIKRLVALKLFCKRHQSRDQSLFSAGIQRIEQIA